MGLNCVVMRRRSFLTAAVGLGVVGGGNLVGRGRPSAGLADPYAAIDAAAARRVFRRDLFPEPVVVASAELLRLDDTFLVRVRSTDGAEGIGVCNNYQMASLVSVYLERIGDFPVGRDVSDLEAFQEAVYLHRSNYKYQGLAFWTAYAPLELALLDMLGRIANRPLHELVGKRVHNHIDVYQANNNRGRTAEESLEAILKNQEVTGARAVKFKIGGRMSNPEVPATRTERLIPMVAAAFDNDVQLYADANGSYDVPEALRIGRLLEAHGIDLYEAPVRFDDFEGLAEVARALNIPVAEGEQEASQQNFRYLLGRGGLSIIQPDLLYYGGLIRATRVARMAAAAGATVVPHLSGAGFGVPYMLHQVAVLPNAGPYHEFKALNPDAIPFECPSVDLRPVAGRLPVPTGPGSGLNIDPAYVRRHIRVTSC